MQNLEEKAKRKSHDTDVNFKELFNFHKSYCVYIHLTNLLQSSSLMLRTIEKLNTECF